VYYEPDRGGMASDIPARWRSTARQRKPARPALVDGSAQLLAILVKAGYPSTLAAVAEHTVFLHPDTVSQTGNSALFPVAPDMMRRGQFAELSDGRRVLLDDNTSPTLAFVWAAGRLNSTGVVRDVQFNHVWDGASDPDTYTALWNVCLTPAFLAKTTDGKNHPEVVAALRYRAWELYQARPMDRPVPEPPEGYDRLSWATSPPPVADLAGTLRARLMASPKSRPATASRTIGWLFSGWKPDTSI
jgi:hypothetical protein